MDKAVSHQASGIEATMKKYNNKLLQLAVMQGENGIVWDAWLPPPLKKDGLYWLDMDQDIWLDYDPSHFKELLPWLTDTSVKEGIPFAQMVVNCQSKIA